MLRADGMKPRLRFAPSPSGYLHIGGARTALFNWLWARREGGQFIVRVEDTDQERSSLDSVRAILKSLRWLGLDWDEGPEVGGDRGPYFQSERRELYRAAIDKLIDSKKAYRCYCTKEELDRARSALRARDPKAQFVYSGTCWERKDEPGKPSVVRFRSPKEGSTDFVDHVFGVVKTPNSVQQDFVIMRSDDFPLYNLAAVVDDHAMGITLVARGRDHIGNTPQQVLLYRAFGYPVPEFAHLPMMLSPRGDKLSKRHAAVSVEDYRQRGFTPDGVINYLVRFGWSFGDQEIFSRQQLVKAFSWDRVGRADGKFDEKKFADVAFEHLKQPELTSDEAYQAGVLPYLKERGLLVDDAERLRKAIATIRPRARSFADAANALDYYFRPEPEFDDKARSKFLKEESAPLLLSLVDALAVDSWSSQALEERFRAFVEDQGIKLKLIAQPARVALTGRSASPPLFDVMEILGREQSLQRLRRAAALAAAGATEN